MAIRTILPPTRGLISLNEAKAQLRVDFDDDDDLISAIILSASALVEASVQRRYIPQQIEWITDVWKDKMVLPVAPGGDSQSAVINSVVYTDTTSTQRILDPSLWWDRPASDTRSLVRRWYAVYPLLGDGPERIVINFSIKSTSVVSPLAKHATKMLVSHFYKNPDAVVGVENRDSSTEIPFGVEQLLSPERWYQ